MMMNNVKLHFLYASPHIIMTSKKTEGGMGWSYGKQETEENT
jgi:hypothetical protein